MACARISPRMYLRTIWILGSEVCSWGKEMSIKLLRMIGGVWHFSRNFPKFQQVSHSPLNTPKKLTILCVYLAKDIIEIHVKKRKYNNGRKVNS